MCVLDDCEGKPVGKGLCAKHYMRQRRSDPGVRKAGYNKAELRAVMGEGWSLLLPEESEMVRQRVTVCLTAAQAFRCEKLGEYLWPTEKLGVEEISRRLLLEHLLWQESERNLVEPRDWNAPEGHVSREMGARIRLPGATLRNLDLSFK